MKEISVAKEFRKSFDLIDYFNKHGFVSIKSAIDISLIKKVKNDLENIFRNYANNSEHNIFDSAVINLNINDKSLLHKLHIASSRIISLKSILLSISPIVSTIMGTKNTLSELETGILLGISKDNRLVYGFHQESSYFTGVENVCHVHFPLFRKSTIKNGTMSILDGSHKEGILDYVYKRKSSDSYTDLLPVNLDHLEKKYQELHLELEVGDCVFFHNQLLHKSNYNNSDLCRPVGTCRLTTSILDDYSKFEHKSPNVYKSTKNS